MKVDDLADTRSPEGLVLFEVTVNGRCEPLSTWYRVVGGSR